MTQGRQLIVGDQLSLIYSRVQVWGTGHSVVRFPNPLASGHSWQLGTLTDHTATTAKVLIGKKTLIGLHKYVLGIIVIFPFLFELFEETCKLKEKAREDLSGSQELKSPPLLIIISPPGPVASLIPLCHFVMPFFCQQMPHCSNTDFFLCVEPFFLDVWCFPLEISRLISCKVVFW